MDEEFPTKVGCKTAILCTAMSAIHLAKNLTYHSKFKHIDVRYHCILDVLEKKQL